MVFLELFVARFAELFVTLAIVIGVSIAGGPNIYFLLFLGGMIGISLIFLAPAKRFAAV
jgi:uncharacterized membrane protein SpoIIM required for sporulation